MLLRRIADWPRYGFRGPFEDLERMRREMDTLFGSAGRGVLRETRAGVFPLINITENKDGFVIRAELPGIKADEIDISVTGDTLSISGERKIPAESEDAKYHRREREAGRFNRIVRLPGQINTEGVEATTVDGVLKILLPKAEEAKPKQITIKSI